MADERENAADALRIFTFMWAAAVLFHQASYNLWIQTLSDGLLTAAAVVALLGPSSVARLTLLLLAQVWAAWEKMPEVPNHWLLAFVMTLSMLLALAVGSARARGGTIDRARVFLDFAPALRLQIVILYAWATFHKLNRDYFDPQVSCAALMGDALGAHYNFLPSGDGARRAAIFGSILLEALIPLCLSVKRLRVPGILLGVAFHIVLTLSPYPTTRVYNFSALLFALYFLFGPEDLPERLRAVWTRLVAAQPWLGSVRARTLLRASGAGLALVIGAGTLNRAESAFWHRVLVGVPVVVFLAYATVVLAAFLLALRGGRHRLPDLRTLYGVRPWLVPACLLVFLNGLSPYIGLKTETSFAMYSNLRTEGGATNHFLIRRPWRVAGFQEDLVTIVKARNSRLRSYAEHGYRLTWFEFRDLLARQDRAVVTYERPGRPQVTIERPADDPELALGPWPGWMRKLLWFRPAKLDGPVECIH
jgi:hypothetical protein